MSVSLWNWSEECEGKPCCGDCDECGYGEMVLAIYESGHAYAAIHHLLKLLEESEVEPDA